MIWKGPEQDGITQSMIGKFNQCPYRFYLYAVLGLKDNTPLHENLIWGDVFHKGLEHYIESRDLNLSVDKMIAYLRSRYPTAPKSYETSTKRMLYKFRLDTYREGTWDTELSFKKSVRLPSGRTVTLRGKKDALCIDHPQYGRMLGEHKCKGYIDPSQLRKELQQDRQANLYCYLHDIEWVNYDLILIPEAQKYSPARSHNESPTEWMERLFTGPCGNYGMFPINQNTHLWIHSGTYHLPRESQERYWQQTIYPDLERMCQFWDWVTQPGFNHEDPKFYNHIFYKTPVRQFNGSFTEKFRCEYYNHLIGDEDLSDLATVDSLFSELEDL